MLITVILDSWSMDFIFIWIFKKHMDIWKKNLFLLESMSGFYLLEKSPFFYWFLDGESMRLTLILSKLLKWFVLLLFYEQIKRKRGDCFWYLQCGPEEKEKTLASDCNRPNQCQIVLWVSLIYYAFDCLDIFLAMFFRSHLLLCPS